MNRTLFLSLLALCVLLTACDSAGPESTPESDFELTVGAPVHASVEGTFSLDAALEASVSRADMQAFRDSLRQGPPSDTTDLPRPPQPDLQPLDPPMTIEGSFTATPGTLSNQVMRPQWSMGGGMFSP